MNKKEEEFIEWIMDKSNKFPYFKDLPEVPMPINYQEDFDWDRADREYEAMRDMEDLC